MNTKATILRPFTSFALAAACVAMLGTSTVFSAQQSRTQPAPRAGASQQTEVMNVTRATNYLGTDVLSSDGRKVGDISDFVFDMSAAPHLAYVVVMTGGFLEMGGDSRAVPASAIRLQDGIARIDISRDDYLRNLPVLPRNSTEFLATPQRQDQLTRAFNVERRGQVQARRAEQRRPSLVTFAELRNASIYSSEGQRLGFAVDAWVDLNLQQAPFIEINETMRSFPSAVEDTRYAIPMARFASRGEFGRLEFNVDSEELTGADPVSEADGVVVLQSGEGPVEDAVLQIRIAEAGEPARAAEGAE